MNNKQTVVYPRCDCGKPTTVKFEASGSDKGGIDYSESTHGTTGDLLVMTVDCMERDFRKKGSVAWILYNAAIMLFYNSDLHEASQDLNTAAKLSEHIVRIPGEEEQK